MERRGKTEVKRREGIVGLLVNFNGHQRRLEREKRLCQNLTVASDA